jgi:gamma-glutamylcyclotransferase (GGCT)/AIG2-like uncharacterized protein YtfP
VPRLFSYGTLQNPDIQRSTFGRTLVGRPDQLPGYELTTLSVAGQATHANARYNGRRDCHVRGQAFQVTDAELQAADRYEHAASYGRVAVELASGDCAWVYVHGADSPR